MKPPFKDSLLLRIGFALAIIISIGFMGMLSSAFIAEKAQGAAGTINSSGSLRMLSYKVATQLASSERTPQSNTIVMKMVDQFDQRVEALGNFNITSKPSLNQAYGEILRRWQVSVRPSIQSALDGKHLNYADIVDSFAGQIDLFVKLLEDELESDIQLLRLIQIASLMSTIMVIAVIMYLVNTDVLTPLKELLLGARRAQQGDLSVRISYKSNDELGLLGSAFNKMAEQLSQVYNDLEELVWEKTAALEQSNHSLDLLYTMTRRLTESSSETNYTKLLNDIETHIGFSPSSICLSNQDRDSAYQLAVVTPLQTGSLNICGHISCERCLKLDKAQTFEIQHTGANIIRAKVYPITDQGKKFGSLVIEIGEQAVEDWQSRLLETVASHIGIALNSSQRTNQEHRLGLLEERSVIARELHDSLAQALSYLKIQVSRLQALQGTEQQTQQAPAIIDELRGGLNRAYGELRELLTTFRLRIDDNGLGVALKGTIEEYSRKHLIQIELNNQVDSHSLNENQEIHILHLIREALSNIVKHAHADHADVALYVDQHRYIHVTISDNGRGISDEVEQLNHYGLTIMKERAETLHGQVEISNLPAGGTQVALVFPPADQQEQHEEVSNV
jgi:two-component system, NarL family, nitrate/nitrite sensor histidine kinase NarX